MLPYASIQNLSNKAERKYQSNSLAYIVFDRASRLAAAAAQSNSFIIIPSLVCIDRVHKDETNRSGSHLIQIAQ